MSRRTRSRSRRRAQMLLPYQAAYPSGSRSLTFGPMLLDHQFENSPFLARILWARARIIHSNSPQLINLVHRISLICGPVTPRPTTADENWNRLAMAAWHRRTADPLLHDTAAAMTDHQMQLWLEERSRIDGDALIVASRGADGGALFTAYEAPQVRGDSSSTDSGQWINGVLVGEHGQPLAYGVATGPEEKAEIQTIPAAAARLYRHHVRPGQPRGLSEISAAIDTAQDLFELDELNKAAIKLAASFGIVETKDLNDAAPDASSLQAARNGQATANQPPEPFRVNGVTAYSAAPGRRLEIIHDSRPSNEQQSYRKALEEAISLVMGLPPEIVRFLAGLTSAASRTTLQIVGDWQKDALADRAPIMSWKWRVFIDCEIAAGRLPRCTDRSGQYDVEWVPRTSWTIDRGRDGQLAINLAREGLTDADRWCVATTGKTFVELAEQRINNLARIRAAADTAGVPLSEVLPGALGSTSTPTDQPQQQGEESATVDNPS